MPENADTDRRAVAATGAAFVVTLSYIDHVLMMTIAMRACLHCVMVAIPLFDVSVSCHFAPVSPKLSHTD